jgi:Ran GTPase-activating protein (RanGAP) involved in mRNA processing and transport
MELFQNTVIVKSEPTKIEFLAICEKISKRNLVTIVWDVLLDSQQLPLLSKAVRSCESLQALEIRNQEWETETLQLFCTMIGSLSLKRLVIEDVRIGDKGAFVFFEAVERMKSLDTLILDGCEIGDDGASKLCEIPSLKSISLCRNLISSEGIGFINNSFASVNSLEKLMLGNNELGDDGMIEIAKSFGLDHFGLTELDVSRNGISSKGLKTILNAVKQTSTVTILDFSQNKINDDIVLLFKFIPICVKNIILEGCPVSDRAKNQLEMLLKSNQELNELERRVKFTSFSHCTASFGRRTT